MIKRIALAACAVGLVVPANAVISTTSLTDPGPADTVYTYVGLLNGASAVAIGPHTFLTAAHIGTGDINLNGTTYHMTNSFTHPLVSDPSNPANKYQVDLTLINVTETLPSYYQIATTSPANGSGITMVGYGNTGVVNSNLKQYNNIGQAGTRRAGPGVVGEHDFFPTNGFASGPILQAPLQVAGDAALAGGDSGGGWFAGGKLVGINDFVNNVSTYQSGPNPGDTTSILPNYGFTAANPNGFTVPTDYYGNPGYTWPANTPYFFSGATDVTNPEIRAWIGQNSTVPEPSSFLALGIAGIALLKRRKRA